MNMSSAMLGEMAPQKKDVKIRIGHTSKKGVDITRRQFFTYAAGACAAVTIGSLSLGSGDIASSGSGGVGSAHKQNTPKAANYDVRPALQRLFSFHTLGAGIILAGLSKIILAGGHESKKA